jgi:hypothetical protein
MVRGCNDDRIGFRTETLLKGSAGGNAERSGRLGGALGHGVNNTNRCEFCRIGGMAASNRAAADHQNTHHDVVSLKPGAGGDIEGAAGAELDPTKGSA